MPNKLAGENSPYLLHHANNPVNWYPWGQEALELARQEGKPIFLSIGYAACHWCHVMASESFEDPDTASIMNHYFVNIKVDREERPDIDDIYMNAVIAMTGHGGWPTSVFLAPDGKPFFGGTYFPPVQRYNLPSFTQVLLSVARTWEKDQAGILDSSRLIYQHIQNTDLISASHHDLPTPELLNQVTQTLADTYDWTFGGWGHSPKFPQAMTLLFLIRRAWRGDQKARDMVSHNLRAMAQGGMYDVVGGGFARYSTDAQWHIPHFEKMLYDNALLSQAYLHAYLITKEDLFRRVCVDTLDFILRELTHPMGGFYSSLDADSEGVEGKYYLWTQDEIHKLLGNDADIFIKAYNITESGDFEGKTVLQRSQDDAHLAHLFNIRVEQIPLKLAALHTILRVERSRRVPPAVDDKILVSWNALMLSAFAEAGRYLRVARYVNAATRNAEFLLQNLFVNNRLYRSWRAGRSLHPAYLEDYAALSLALLDLYQTDPQNRWFKTARNLTIQLQSLFSDHEGGFFDTAVDHDPLIIRPKNIQDNATPCGNSLAANLLLRFSAYTGKQEWRSSAEDMIASITQNVTRYPTSFAQWLSGMDFSLHPIREVAILGDIQDTQTRALIDCLWSEYMPNTVAAISKYPPDEGAPELLNARTLINGLPTAYVCQNFNCKLPVNTASDLLIQLQ